MSTSTEPKMEIIPTEPQLEKSTDDTPTDKEPFPQLEYDRYFLEWLKSVKHSIITTSYKTNYIFNIGFTTLIEPEPREQLSFWMTQSSRCMGAAKSDNGKDIWVGNMSFLTKYRKSGEHSDEGEGYKRSPFDGLYIPRKIHVTSDIDIHDIVVPSKGPTPGIPHFISAVYSCVCVPSDNSSFKVFWRPPWVSKIAAEDRTHLNGLCCVNGEPRYVTSAARSDVRGGWREHKNDGGVIYDIVNNALVTKNLSMPHSPRWHDGKLWVLNSGKGEFGYIDFSRTQESDDESYYPFVAKCFIPGYLRGLDFIDNRYAVIGSSDDRHEATFQGLELGKRLLEKKTTAKCGIHVVDLKTFDIIHEMTFKKPITELYDVVTIPHTVRPMLEELQPLQLARHLDFEE
jgi:uncharacterized protein (TIGR03032 family)